MRATFAPTWLALVAVVILGYVLIRGLTNPRTRPFLIGLGAIFALVMFFSFGVAVHSPQQMPPQTVVMSQSSPQVHRTEKVTIPRNITTGMSAQPPKTLTLTEQPKMTVIMALRQAIIQEWKTRNTVPIAEAPEKKAEPVQADTPTLPQRPTWVGAAPKTQDGCYTTSVSVGPYTSQLECDRALPNAIQAAARDYAGLALGAEAASVLLPEDALQQLVRDRWNEDRPMEIDGRSENMVMLHAKLVFDDTMRQRIKFEADRLVIQRRLQRVAVVFGGVLGVLGLAWSGLKLVTRRHESKAAGQESQRTAVVSAT
jgi:hypothetical protein